MLDFMTLYHYTSIDSLACILKNKTIRFTRLDLLDDLEENIQSSGVNIGNYAFASCWTDDKEESIPLWKMYTENGIGVRLAVDSDMFMDYNNPEKLTLSGITLSTNDSPLSITKTPLEDFINPNIMLLPITSTEMNNQIFKKVEYVDNVYDRTKDCVKIVQGENNYSRVFIFHPHVGKYKNIRWAFQKEVRFVLLIFPGKQFSSTEAFPKEYEQWLFDVWTKNIPKTISHYDMHLKSDVIDTMEITLSPSMPISKQIIVEALVSQYAPHAKVSHSVLNPTVRLK